MGSSAPLPRVTMISSSQICVVGGDTREQPPNPKRMKLTDLNLPQPPKATTTTTPTTSTPPTTTNPNNLDFLMCSPTIPPPHELRDCDLTGRSKPWHYLLTRITNGIRVIKKMDVYVCQITTMDEACLLYNCITGSTFDWVAPPVFNLRKCKIQVNTIFLHFSSATEAHLALLLNALKRYHICTHCPLPQIHVFANEWKPTNGQMWFFKEWLRIMSSCIIELNLSHIFVPSPETMNAFLDGLSLPNLKYLLLSDYLRESLILQAIVPPSQPPVTNNDDNDNKDCIIVEPPPPLPQEQQKSPSLLVEEEEEEEDGEETEDEEEEKMIAEIRRSHHPIFSSMVTSDFILPLPPTTTTTSPESVLSSTTLRKNPFVPNLTKFNHSVCVLELRNIRLHEPHMNALLDCLKYFHSLHSLDLSRNNPISAKKLRVPLRSCKELKSFKLEMVTLTEQKSLGLALQECKNLQFLSLNWTKIDPKPLKTLNEHLRQLPKLEFLSMRTIGLGQVTGQMIIPLIREMPQLRELNLMDNDSLVPSNPTGDSTIGKIWRQFCQTPHLRSLQLAGDIRRFVEYPEYFKDIHHTPQQKSQYERRRYPNWVHSILYPYTERQLYEKYKQIDRVKLMLLYPIRLVGGEDKQQLPQQQQQQKCPFLDDFYLQPLGDINLIGVIVFRYLGFRD
jgi:hypothetical protein